MSSHCARCGKPIAANESSLSTRPEDASLCVACRDRTIDVTRDDGRAEETETWHKPRDPRQRVAQFTLVRRLGHGSFGDVWLADDSKLGREVALKLPTRDGDDSLLHEAKTAASLRHPNIVAVYEVGEANGRMYIASELIDGMTLRDFLSAGRPPLKRVTGLLIAITKALQFAHEHGVVHRDVKPANILLDRAGKPYVNDFGLAKRLSADETISSEGQVVGTARYMSPEQAYGKTEDTEARSDIYAVGVMLFEMLTGESPFRGTARAILQQKVSQDAPSPRLLEPSIPRDLETICLKCLEREPGNRFETAGELVSELKRFADGEPIQSRPIGRMERGWRWCKRRPAIASLLLALALSLTGGFVGITHYWLQSISNAYDAKQKLYRSWMNLAAVQENEGSPSAVRALLARITADPELAPMRGLEFGYLADAVEKVTPVGIVGGPVIDIAISNDGTTCAVIAGDADQGAGDITVWSVTEGRRLRLLGAEQEGFFAIDFSKANSQMVAGCKDGYIRVYEPLKGDQKVRELFHGPPVKFVAFSPDGKFVIAAGVKGAVRIWGQDQELPVVEVPTGKGETRAIRFSPDGARLYTARDDGRIRQWAMDELLKTAPGKVPVPEAELDTAPRPLAMSISETGDQLVLGFFNARVTVHDLPFTSEHSEPRVFSFDRGLIQGIEHLGNSPLVAVLTSFGNLYLFDTTIGREANGVSTHSGNGVLARSGAGRLLLIGSGDGSVSAIKPQQFAKPMTMWGPKALRDVAFLSPTKALAAYEDENVWLWDLATGKRIRIIHDAGKTMLIAVNSARHLVATAGSRSGVEIRDDAELRTIAKLPTAPAGVSAMQFSPAGELLVIALRRGPIRAYQTGNWKEPRFEVPWDGHLVSSIAVSIDSELVAVARQDNAIDLRRVSDGKVSTTIELEQEVPSVIHFCEDGVTLAVGTRGGTLLLYDLKLGSIRQTIKGHTGAINDFAVIPGTRTLVSGGRDRELRFWDLDSGELITQFAGHFRQIFTVAASEDGKA